MFLDSASSFVRKLVLLLCVLSWTKNLTQAATCGYGNVGDGVCPDVDLCCSKWGWCGYTAQHCAKDTEAPTPSPNEITYNQQNEIPDSRLVAFVGNWHPCPTPDQFQYYTHIVISFAVSYTWSPSKNICSTTCQIEQPPVCNNRDNAGLIRKWRAAGKKVLLSFGGAGMGGSWPSSPDDCWDYCFGREKQVVNRLTEIVEDMDLDGVDIDYEYFLEDNQNGLGFTKGRQAQRFLLQITSGLRKSLPKGAIVSHAPMEYNIVPGEPYFDLLMEMNDDIDFIMPQYYNGLINPKYNVDDAIEHYTVLVDSIFYGNPTKVVFGFCISECGNFNVNGAEAAWIMRSLSAYGPSCHGGAFFWVANDDVDGSWSQMVKPAIAQPYSDCVLEEFSSSPHALNKFPFHPIMYHLALTVLAYVAFHL